MVAVHDADAPVPASEHVVPPGVNEIVPVGIVAPLVTVSVTVAVHDVACPTVIVAGVQDTVVVVE